jgi:ribosomal protein S18 acetylase RimI-like enzyme
MNEPIRRIGAGDDMISLRRQTPDDAAFLYHLFRANTLRTLELSGLPLVFLNDLIEMQHRSRMQTYRSMFPDAVWSIVERAGAPIGEIVENDEADCIYVVDIALLPELQGRGIGTALMRAVMDESRSRLRAVRAKVIVTNEPSLKMFRKLGFAAAAPDAMAFVNLRWTAETGPSARPRIDERLPQDTATE